MVPEPHNCHSTMVTLKSTADLKLAGTTPVMSDKLSIFNIVGPSAGHKPSLNIFAGKGPGGR